MCLFTKFNFTAQSWKCSYVCVPYVNQHGRTLNWFSTRNVWRLPLSKRNKSILCRIQTKRLQCRFVRTGGQSFLSKQRTGFNVLMHIYILYICIHTHTHPSWRSPWCLECGCLLRTHLLFKNWTQWRASLVGWSKLELSTTPWETLWVVLFQPSLTFDPSPDLVLGAPFARLTGSLATFFGFPVLLV